MTTLPPVAEQLRKFRDHLAELGLKYTRQRRVIAEVFFATAEHVTLTDLLDRARAVYDSIGYATVYRTMKVLTEAGLAIEHKFVEGQARYEVAVDGEHHDHIVCTTCGRIVEYHDETIERRQLTIAAERGFRVVSHRHVIFGECLDPQCSGRVDLDESGD